MPVGMTYRFTMFIDPDLGERMNAAIAARHETKRAFVERAIKTELERIEDEESGRTS